MIVACREKGWMEERSDFIYWSNLCRSFKIKLKLVDRLEDVKFPGGYEIVILDETGTQHLRNFVHPQKAIYIFGRSGQKHIQNYVVHDHVVRVDTPKDNSIFAISIAGMVLYDRMVKNDDARP